MGELDEAALVGDKWGKLTQDLLEIFFEVSWHLKTSLCKKCFGSGNWIWWKYFAGLDKNTVFFRAKRKSMQAGIPKKEIFLRSKNIVIRRQYTNKIKKKSTCKDKTRCILPKSITTQNQRIRATSNKIFDKNCLLQQEKSVQKTCEKNFLFVCKPFLWNMEEG